jgi:hypothetical protein
VLRAELTMQRPEEFQVYRRIEGSPKGPLMWPPMRRGIADLHRRAEVSQGVNDRYLNALASTDGTTRLKELLAPLERPVIKEGKRSRACGRLMIKIDFCWKPSVGASLSSMAFATKIYKNCCI